MIYFNDQYVTIWEVEDKETYAIVKFSTSRKDKKTDPATYKNSSWSFVKFVADAYNPELLALEPKTRLKVKGGLSKEEYLKDGVRTWPQNPQFVVFHWDLVENSGDSTPTTSKMDKPPVVESSPIDEDEDPFADKA